MKFGDEIDSEKIAVIVLYEFVANDIIRPNESLKQKILCRKFRTIADYESINDITINY